MGFFSKKDDAAKVDAKSPVHRTYSGVGAGRQPSSAAKSMATYYERKAASSAALQAELESVKRSSSRNNHSSKSRMCSPGRIWMHLLTVTQIGIAVAIIGVVYGGLMETESVSTDANGESGAHVSTTVCYGTTRSVNVCSYSIWASGASIVLSVVISLMNCMCPRRNYTFCLSVEALLGLVGAAWWLAAGIVAVVLGAEADDDNLPKGDMRTVVWILCFSNAAAFALSFFSTTLSCCTSCCGANTYDDDMV